ncbi:hypothetical protein GQ43DRAFT_36392 [Delitschia confertaspora ATCC 74209]|uniref:Uncharacterized protein n=1 Tax=Delitschia confertaspora ATCC 74209 TaxID=1513339 RepID=A0A9P4JTL3_9PLEO|nr:hypothetical protein GQ43DRAFT_36392 [Delitschia confertaspora ATCC 74209]
MIPKLSTLFALLIFAHINLALPIETPNGLDEATKWTHGGPPEPMQKRGTTVIAPDEAISWAYQGIPDQPDSNWRPPKATLVKMNSTIGAPDEAISWAYQGAPDSFDPNWRPPKEQ